MVHDERRNPEDMDTTLEDHSEDSVRYLVMERPKPKVTTKSQEDMLFVQAMRVKKQRSIKNQPLKFKI